MHTVILCVQKLGKGNKGTGRLGVKETERRGREKGCEGKFPRSFFRGIEGVR